MARSDMDSLSLRLEPLDLSGVLDEALALGEGMAEARDVRLSRGAMARDRCGCAATLTVCEAAVPGADRQCRPLFAPGRQRGALRRAGRIRRKRKPAIEVTISDQGIGIAEEDIPQIFERGYRGPAAAAHCADGSGLGLPIARCSPVATAATSGWCRGRVAARPRSSPCPC